MNIKIQVLLVFSLAPLPVQAADAHHRKLVGDSQPLKVLPATTPSTLIPPPLSSAEKIQHQRRRYWCGAACFVTGLLMMKYAIGHICINKHNAAQ